MTTTELKSCPFCGCEAEITRHGNSKQSQQYSCTECHCTLETPEVHGDIGIWNTRTQSSHSVKRLREALEGFKTGEHDCIEEIYPGRCQECRQNREIDEALKGGQE